MCLYPTIIKNRKYMSNKKNKGKPPEIKDGRTAYVPVGCGKCMECMKKKAREWMVRLQEDIKEHKNGIFVTLTFSNQEFSKLSKEISGLSGYELDNEIATLAVRRFLERWRKKYKKSVRHWLVTELGHNGTENIHLHGIIWTENEHDIPEIWKYGIVWTPNGKHNGPAKTKNKGWVNQQTINYITKYIHKQDETHREYKPKVLTSPGIGRRYIKSHNAQLNKYRKGGETNDTYKNRQGYKMALPIYWRNHIYSEEEREKLWIEKLDKNKRYINGIEIDISKNEDSYYKVLKTEQERNKRLGYGNNSINWERKKYERERRNLMHKKRKGIE